MEKKTVITMLLNDTYECYFLRTLHITYIQGCRRYDSVIVDNIRI